MDGDDTNIAPQQNGGDRRWRMLLLLPFFGLVWVPFYNVVEPSFYGLPFFYWYQFIWVFITPALTWIVFRKTD
nr:MAG: DUF3311 domain-containing protein [Hyphomicrobiales bacterium]